MIRIDVRICVPFNAMELPVSNAKVYHYTVYTVPKDDSSLMRIHSFDRKSTFFSLKLMLSGIK